MYKFMYMYVHTYIHLSTHIYTFIYIYLLNMHTKLIGNAQCLQWFLLGHGMISDLDLFLLYFQMLFTAYVLIF